MSTDAPFRPITSLLVANRGEIAWRIMRTARAMGMATVAVFSDADADSPHVAAADVAMRLPGTSPAETYLRTERILDAAVRAGADAIHPGYGFLSESGAFARAVIDGGLVWVGPPPEAMDAMSSKIGAKKLMTRAGVATLPAVAVGGSSIDSEADTDADQEEPVLPDEAALDTLGWPLLVKASAAGGGRGMRVVTEYSALGDAVRAASREAASAFGDGTVFLERLVESPRHIEVQIVGDAHGNVVALFERECSIQRRHQKLIEECPSPVVSPTLRAQLSASAVAAARAVGYTNAGTVEFVLDTSEAEGNGTDVGGRAYFLEMNTRLQVEHPVTEMVSGLDLVRLQLLVAQGHALPPEVRDAAEAGPQGHAIEARLYAEDPARQWLPQTGTLHRFEIDDGRPGIRVDRGVATGSVIGPYYDAMLAKVVVHAPTRAEATAELAATLAGARIHGVTTNRDLLVRVLRHGEFASGRTDTGFIERIGLDGPDGLAVPQTDGAALDRHAVVAALAARAKRRNLAAVQATIPAGFRNNPSALQEVTFVGDRREITVGYGCPPPGVEQPQRIPIEVDGKEFAIDNYSAAAESVVLCVDGTRRSYRVDHAGEMVFVDGPDGSTSLRVRPRFPLADQQGSQGSALAPMPGSVVRVAVAAGDRVEAGSVLVVLEAMKMEHAVHSSVSGTVAEVDVEVGDQVEAGRLLAVVHPDEPSDPDAQGDRGGSPR